MLRRGRKFLTLRIRSRLPAEVLGTAKTAISVEPCTLPSKARSGQANSDILYRQSPNSTTKGTKEHEGTLYYSTLCANARRSWFKIRKLHLRILDHLLLAGRKLPAFTRPITSARTQLLSAQLASPQCESPLSGGTLKGRMGDLTSST